LLEAWLGTIGVNDEVARADVETQFTIPSGKRPDIAISSDEWCVLVESKLGSGFGETQVRDYLEYLGHLDGHRALVLLTQYPEAVPADLSALADSLAIKLVSQRWHDIGAHLGDPGEDTLGGDFVQLLIREGLVKPKALDLPDWHAWNAGYNVLLRLDALLEELDPHVQQTQPNSRRRSGLTKRWIYRVWRADPLEVGLGFGAAAGDSSPHSPPIMFAFVGVIGATREDAIKAVGAETGGRWSDNEQLQARSGLFWDWPAVARPSAEVLTGGTFEEQVAQAAAFMRETRDYYVARGYLPPATHGD
jgi:hypothetical protein